METSGGLIVTPDMRSKGQEYRRTMAGLEAEVASLRIALRDQFAMAALQGFLASGMAESSTYDDDAGSAYKWADAMLKARAAGGEKDE